MSYEVFKRRVNALLAKIGGNVSAKFSTDAESGRHCAACSDGTTIIANTSSLKVTVKWGSGHSAMATI